MLDEIRRSVADVPAHLRLHAAREFLQRLLLQALDDAGFRRSLAFMGGTALRIVHGTPRFSEDLDFSLRASGRFSIRDVADALSRRMKGLGFDVGTTKAGEGKAVGSFFLRFAGLPHALGLSALRGQKLSIKIEVDANPPRGARVEEFVGSDSVLFAVDVYDWESLFATKLHAFLYRKYEKGRDWFDLLLFLGRPGVPNFTLFRNAVRQTHPTETFESLDDVWSAVREKVERMDEAKIQDDVRPFLLRDGDERRLTRAALLAALKRDRTAK